jgi:hypothetical protein
MQERSGPTVAGGLWLGALATLLTTAWVAKPVAANLVSLAVVGHALTGVALTRDRRTPEESGGFRGRAFTAGVLAVFLLGELVGTLLALRLGLRALGLWFELAASFSLVGIAATFRRLPGDGVFATQIAFHATLLLPLVSAVLTPVELRWALETTSIGLALVVLTVLPIPLLLMTIGDVLAYCLDLPAEDRSRAWEMLVAHQGLLLIMLVRWARVSL